MTGYTIGYTITLTNVTEGNVPYIFNTTTNTTNITVSDLSPGAEYYFSVAGIDTGGGVGAESVPSNTLMLDSECYNKKQQSRCIGNPDK